MKTIVQNLPRLEGQKWNIQKLHSLLHLAEDIVNFGSTEMFNASRPESFHQPVAKDPGRKCQKTHQNWNLMVAKRVQESHALSVFEEMMGFNDNSNNDSTHEPTFDNVKNRSTKFTIIFDLPRQAVGTRWGTKSDVRKMDLDPELLAFLIKYYKLNETGGELTGFTECLVKCNDGRHAVVRCHPYFQAKGPWHDWGTIKFGRRFVPAKFHCWIDQGDAPPHAIVECAASHREKEDSVLSRTWTFPMRNRQHDRSRFHVMKMDQYMRPCLVFQKKTTQAILEVLPYQMWHRDF